MLLIYSSSILVLSYKWLTISYSCPRIIIYKSISAMLVSSLALDIVAAVISVVVAAFGGILFNFFYCNRSSNYITEPYREYYGGFY